MKKLFLLAALIVAINLSTFAQSLVVSPTTVESGGLITLTGTDESSASRIQNIQYDYYYTTTSSPSTNYQVYITVTDGTLTQSFNPGLGTPIPTKYTFKVANLYSSPITVNIGFTVSLSGGSQVTRNVTVTVNPAPPQQLTYHNVEKTGVFTKNDCGVGTVGSQVAYTVPAGTASCNSTISQADADSKAQSLVNSNGQLYANTNGVCREPSIRGFQTVTRGGEYVYNVDYTASDDVLTWSVPNTAATIDRGQGTNAIGITVKTISGTQPGYFNLTLNILGVNGNTRTISYPIKSMPGSTPNPR